MILKTGGISALITDWGDFGWGSEWKFVMGESKHIQNLGNCQLVINYGGTFYPNTQSYSWDENCDDYRKDIYESWKDRQDFLEKTDPEIKKKIFEEIDKRIMQSKDPRSLPFKKVVVLTNITRH